MEAHHGVFKGGTGHDIAREDITLEKDPHGLSSLLALV